MSATATRKRKVKETPVPSKPVSLVLPRKTRPSKVVSRTGWRTDLQHGYVVQENGHRELVVTNSYMLARFPINKEVPLGPIHVEALKRIEKGEAHEVLPEGGVALSLDSQTKVTYTAPVTKRLAPYDKPLELEWPEDKTVRIALNPALLKNLADAINAGTSVALDIVVNDAQTTLKPIRVRATNWLAGDPEGVLMPIRRNA